MDYIQWQGQSLPARRLAGGIPLMQNMNAAGFGSSALSPVYNAYYGTPANPGWNPGNPFKQALQSAGYNQGQARAINQALKQPGYGQDFTTPTAGWQPTGKLGQALQAGGYNQAAKRAVNTGLASLL